MSAFLSEKRGGHSYDNDATSDCKFNCGCWMGGSRSGGPGGIDPFGKCPNNPNIGKSLSVMAQLNKLTYAIQHNPNCKSPFLVRLVGTGFIDYKIPEETSDILGYGKTLKEAAKNALANKKP